MKWDGKRQQPIRWNNSVKKILFWIKSTKFNCKSSKTILPNLFSSQGLDLLFYQLFILCDVCTHQYSSFRLLLFGTCCCWAFWILFCWWNDKEGMALLSCSSPFIKLNRFLLSTFLSKLTFIGYWFVTSFLNFISFSVSYCSFIFLNFDFCFDAMNWLCCYYDNGINEPCLK